MLRSVVRNRIVDRHLNLATGGYRVFSVERAVIVTQRETMTAPKLVIQAAQERRAVVGLRVALFGALEHVPWLGVRGSACHAGQGWKQDHSRNSIKLLLDGSEIKSTVLDQRTTEGAAELMAVLQRLEIERILQAQLLLADKVKRVSVWSIGATLRNRCDDTA